MCMSSDGLVYHLTFKFYILRAIRSLLNKYYYTEDNNIFIDYVSSSRLELCILYSTILTHQLYARFPTYPRIKSLNKLVKPKESIRTELSGTS